MLARFILIAAALTSANAFAAEPSKAPRAGARTYAASNAAAGCARVR